MVSVSPLEVYMQKAMDGSLEDARNFFVEFLRRPLFVPERYQSPAIEQSAPYPNEFINLLGLQVAEQVFVPAFSSASQIQEWCGRPLTYKTVTGKQLLELIPPTWSISINPGMEVEKDISPWEIGELRAGESGIESVLEELFGTEIIESLQVRALQADEHKAILLALSDYAKDVMQIEEILCAIEEGLDIDGIQKSTIIIGAIISSTESAELEAIRQSLEAIADKNHIGFPEPIKVYAANNKEGVMLGAFRGIIPFYKKPSITKSWFNLFNRHL